MLRLAPSEIVRRYISGDDAERQRIDKHLDYQRQRQRDDQR